MTPKEKVWITVFAVTGLLTAAAGHWPYFPGDVATARFVQSLAPVSMDWAKGISSTGKFPWSLALLALTVGLSCIIAGWRAALLALAGYAGMLILGILTSPLIARPRPSPDLVHVAEKLSGYSFPSMLVLALASTFGFLAVLFAVKTSGALRLTGVIACCLILLLGLAARISLGAHWPSDVMLSSLIGLLWAALLIHFS